MLLGFNLLADIVYHGRFLQAFTLRVMQGCYGIRTTPKPGVRYKHTSSVKKRWYFFLTILHGNQCFYCKRPFNQYFRPTIDHKTPLVKGGTDEFYNFVMACGWCNRKKGARKYFDSKKAQQRADNRYYYNRRRKYKLAG